MPSVVYGILGLIIFVQALDPVTGGRSVIAAGLTMAVLVLPIVIITTVEALSAVPDGAARGGYGVGRTRWEVITDHVLPYAAPGILTGTILALARALGEAAPLILVGPCPGLAHRAERCQLPRPDPRSLHGDALRDLQLGPAAAGGVQGRVAAAAILVLLFVVLLANSAAVLLRNHYEKKRG